MADDYQRALDEYEAICAYHRSEDQLKWQVLGIAYGGGALLAATAVGRLYSYAAVCVAALAAAAVTLGTAVYCRLSKYTMWRLERAWTLEESVLKFDHHLHLRAKHAEEHGRNGVDKIIKLGYWLPWVLWVALLAVTIAKH